MTTISSSSCAPPDLEVVRIVPRGDLERASPELRVHAIVGDHRQAPADERQNAVPADQIAEATVLGVHRNGGVGEHRLGANGGDRDHLIGALQG